MEADLGTDALWVRDQVHEILRAADPGGWSADKAEELRRRVHAIVAAVRQRRTHVVAPGSSSARFAERLRSLVATMERALPAESTRSRWTAFVGEVHPEYEAFVAALPPGADVASPNHRPTNYARSFFHLASAGTGFVAVAVLPSRAVLLAIACVFVTYVWSMEIVRRRSPAFNARIMRMYARVAHPHEWYRVNSGTWYATALVVLAAFASRPGMLAALAVLGVADPFAAFVGRRYGRHKLRSGKSVEGALAFVASGTLAALGGLALLPTGSIEKRIALAFVAAAAGAAAEVWISILDDNFTIPVVVGAVVTLGTMG